MDNLKSRLIQKFKEYSVVITNHAVGDVPEDTTGTIVNVYTGTDDLYEAEFVIGNICFVATVESHEIRLKE
ncbi:MAG: hypothetical protein GY861_05685 [bacterium]|nr:hypothetical protein [bacterium]